MTVRVEVVVSGCDEHHHEHHRHRVVSGRFPGLSVVTSWGNIPMAQTVPASTAMTGPLMFVDQFGNPGVGPMGVLSSDVPLTSLSLSADGQSFNFMSPASGSVTLLWHDPAGNVPDFSGVFTDTVVLTLTGQFGTAVAGTTA